MAALRLEEGKVTGVELANKEVIRAKRVISAIGVRATVERLLPSELRRENWSTSIQNLRPGPAHVCLYLGFKGDIRSAGAGSANQWFWRTYDTEVDEWSVRPEEPLGPASVLYTSFPSLKDPQHDPGPEMLHTGEVVTFVPWSVFDRWKGSRRGHRGETYEAFKAAMKEKLLEQLFSHRPGLKPMLEWAELSTPLSTDLFCRPVQGSIYGLAPTPNRYENPWLRPRSPVPGLFFAGSEVATVGVIGAMMGGVLAALAAEPLAGFQLLKQVQS